ncbi:MAG TPA: DUF2254 family protein [Vicinamibacterales bacterium]|nr:DUF2254 family protein [Vicinamibacterales bacterium]
MHAYSVAATTLLSRRSAVREYLHGAYWVLPTLGIVIGLGAGALLSIIPVEPGSLIDKVMFQGTAGDARGVLIVVSATMITTTGIVFSLTVLSLQIASSQFSVRLLRTFLRDVPNQVVLAIFVCTFAYATGGLLTVGEHAGGGAFVPKVAVTGSLALAFISIGALVFFLHHLVHSIQIDTIMEGVQRRTLALVDDLFPDPDTPEADQPAPQKPPSGAVPLLAPKSGYLQTVDVGDLADLASATAHSVQLVVFVGDYVTAGSSVGWCWRRGPADDPTDPDVLQRILRHVHIGFERTLQQDIRFGLRQMVDIALRALSPAINDPYTGVQVVHHVSAVEAVLASRAIHDDVRRDGSGAVWYGCRTRVSRRPYTSGAPRSAVMGHGNRWCSLRCFSCYARWRRTASMRRVAGPSRRRSISSCESPNANWPKSQTGPWWPGLPRARRKWCSDLARWLHHPPHSVRWPP